MRSISSSKRGSIELLVPGILTIVLGAALLVFGLMILGSLKDSTANLGTTVTLEKLTNVVNESGVSVAHIGDCGFNGFVVTSVKNNSGAIVIAAPNWTYTSAGVVSYVPSDDLLYNNTIWNVTYSYNRGDLSCESANKSIVGLGTFADYWEIIVLAIVITIVLGMLIVLLGRKAARVR